MNNLRNILFLSVLALLTFFSSGCIEDGFTTSSDDILTFSRDTVDFDTVFTDLGTPTARLIVHNRAKKSVNISRISFTDPNGYFQLNVDGMSGKVFENVEIRAQDSIYVFIECYIPEHEWNGPVLMQDKLEFITNGVLQSVQVEAYGQNVTRLRNMRITEDTRLTKDLPYVVFDSLVVDPGVTLTIDPGTQMLFHDNASLVVHGTLIAEGFDGGGMIQMRGDRLDKILPNVPYDLMSGQWGGVRFTAESFDNQLSYVNMRSSTYGVQIDSCGNLEKRKLRLQNSWLHNSSSNVLNAVHAWIEAYGVCFSEAAESVVQLTGGRATFLQCTFANNYLFSIPSSSIITLLHASESTRTDDNSLFMNATFLNSIVYGMGGPINIGDLDGTDIWFKNVLIGADGSDDEHFISCIWNEDPLFYTVRADYVFNYRLREGSPAIGAGNAAYLLPICQYDMYGLDRYSTANPDLGAFVYAPSAEQ
jgi:hypothetical protein